MGDSLTAADGVVVDGKTANGLRGALEYITLRRSGSDDKVD